MTIRAVIFDLGHTLWDIRPGGDALACAYADLRATLVRRLGRDDVPAAADLQRAVRDALVEAGEMYLNDDRRLEQPPTQVWVDRGCRAVGLELGATLLREVTPPLFATELDRLVCADGTRDAVGALAADGYRIGCITNTLAEAATIRSMLRRHGFDGLMQSVVVSSEEGWRKPHPSLFEKAMRDLGVTPGQSLFVGDSPVHDIGGARAAGMWAVLSRQYVARPYDGMAPPHAVIDHLRELPAVIARLEAAS